LNVHYVVSYKISDPVMSNSDVLGSLMELGIMRQNHRSVVVAFNHGWFLLGISEFSI
jgi:hypothetical protein